MENIKKCKQCLVRKPITDFYMYKRKDVRGETYDAIQAKCKKCESSRHVFLQKKREKVKSNVKMDYRNSKITLTDGTIIDIINIVSDTDKIKLVRDGFYFILL